MTQNSNLPPEDPVRPHSYDGIQEYDKRLPNWWLTTFYGAIVFAVGYWFYFAQSGVPRSDAQRVDAAMSAIQASKLTSTVGTLDDDGFWAMSQNSVLVSAGEKTFLTTCASCHNEKLTGGIGPNLVDHTWLHGGRPTEIYATVTNGVVAKGMPPWAPILGAKKVSEVVAFILSKHNRTEPEMSGAPLTTAAASH